jgi:hypothetical protein
MNTSRCHNCGSDQKSDISNPWCDECFKAVNDAREKAASEGADVGQAQRTALWQRGHDPHRGRADSRTRVQRVQFDSFLNRIAVEPGSADDPRRGRLPS